MDDVDIHTEFGGAIARNVAQKRRSHYRPPYALAETVDRAQAATSRGWRRSPTLPISNHVFEYHTNSIARSIWPDN